MRSLFQSLQIKLSSSVNLPKIYIWFNSNSELCKQYSFSLKAVCDLIEHSLHLSFLFFRFGLWRLSFISLFISLHQPLFPFSRRVHRGHLFLQSKTRKYLLWVTFMKNRIFSRDILAFQLSLWRYLAVYKRTLFLNWLCVAGRTLSPSYGC